MKFTTFNFITYIVDLLCTVDAQLTDVRETDNRTTPTSPSFHSDSFGRPQTAAAHDHLAFTIQHHPFFKHFLRNYALLISLNDNEGVHKPFVECGRAR